MPQFLHCGYIRRERERRMRRRKKSRGSRHVCLSPSVNQSLTHWLNAAASWTLQLLSCAASPTDWLTDWRTDWRTGWLDDSVDRTKERTKVVGKNLKHFQKRSMCWKVIEREGWGRGPENCSLVARCPCCCCQGISLVNFAGSRQQVTKGRNTFIMWQGQSISLPVCVCVWQEKCKCMQAFT